MVKCLIRIKTKVNVHLRMINHCYRDVKVRVLTLGPRLLSNVLGALPLIPALPESSSSSGISLSPYGQSYRAADSLRVSGQPMPEHSGSSSTSLLSPPCSGPEGKNGEAPFSEGSHKPPSDVLLTPEFKSTNDQESMDPESVPLQGGTLACSKPREKASHLGKLKPATSGMETQQTGGLMAMLARRVLVMLALLFALLVLLFALIESTLDVPVLRDIRETSEFQQLHYAYFCPVRRWLTCTLRWIGVLLIKE